MFKISVMELVVCLSEVIDLMSEEIRDHHKRVACGAYLLAEACGITGEERRDIVIAAALHDIGGLSLEARKTAALHFEDTNSHAEKGYKLLSGFAPFRTIATLVRYHHAHWNHGKGTQADGSPIALGSQIILMADRIAVTLTPGILALTQAQLATDKIVSQSGAAYRPELVEAFLEVAPRDIFWLNTMSQSFYDSIMGELKSHDIILSGEYLDAMLDLLSNIIDFRSAFTMMHSRGVSIVAEKLAALMGLSKDDCYTMRVAALLHDIGKLAIPSEILDKPGPLDEHERAIMRTHSYYTDKVLSSLSGFAKVQQWAASHHEKLNGHGYPYGYHAEELTLGARIIKVADIFVALVEDRPYRKGMKPDEIIDILHTMIDDHEVEKNIVTTLFANMEIFEELLHATSREAALEYSRFSSATYLPQAS